jgi:membrane peptidoglycan carboxypeptidase
VAAKTGTTDNFKDAVTVAFTPDIAAAIWVGDVLDNNHFMYSNSDGIYVASPGMHTFIAKALAGVPGNRWYTKPADVVGGPGNSWFLSDTRSIAKLPGDSGLKPSPKPVPFVVPPDPGTGPIIANPPPSPTPSPAFCPPVCP